MAYYVYTIILSFKRHFISHGTEVSVSNVLNLRNVKNETFFELISKALNLNILNFELKKKYHIKFLYSLHSGFGQ